MTFSSPRTLTTGTSGGGNGAAVVSGTVAGDTGNYFTSGSAGARGGGGGGGTACGADKYNSQTLGTRTNGGAGGAGLVIVRYLTPSVSNSCTPVSYPSGSYTVVEFQGAGTCSWTVPTGVTKVEALAVGGGGGGGSRIGGGGGGGGVVTQSNVSVTPAASVSVTVGAGGSGGGMSGSGSTSAGSVGSSSSFGSVSALGGGGGGSNGATYVATSGAGGGGVGYPGCPGTAGSGTAGASGGTCVFTSNIVYAGGGGGGGSSATAGANGNAVSTVAGAGGSGTSSSITGTSVVYGGGGGGGIHTDATTDKSPGTGGAGGGGAGAAMVSTSRSQGAAGVAGIDGLGGGGGGGSVTDNSNAAATGGDGGDGVVVVRYYTSARSLSVSQQPGSYGVRTGWSTVPKVQVVDGSGSAVALSGVTVTASFNATSGSATLSNATAVTDASGIATFTNLTVSGAPATAGTLTFSADLLASGTSSSFTITGVTLTLPSSAGVSAGTATSMGVGSSAVSDFAASDTVLVTLSTTAGSLSITSSTGLSTVTGYQSPVTAAASSIAFTGTQANVNAALQTLRLNATGSSATVSGSAVLAGTAYYPTNGHYYEVVTPTSSIGWVSAKAAAEARTFNGLTGYLATITSAAENEFIAGKLTNDGWMGASDTTTEGTWKWMTGPESGTTFWNGAASGSAPAGQYANWTSGEPNNSSHAGCSDGEDYGQFYRVTAKWNDLPCASSAAGLLSSYIVEYGGLSGETAYAQSTSSTAVTIANVPGAPTGVTATAGQLTAAVSWTAPTSDGGSAITGYTVTSSPGSFTCSPSPATSTSCTVTGLTAGTDYTFTVVATNVVGSSSSSTASSSVTPFGAVTQFSVTQSGGSTALATQTAGTASSVRVRALDSGGRLNTAYTGTVSLTSTAFSGTVSAVIASGLGAGHRSLRDGQRVHGDDVVGISEFHGESRVCIDDDLGRDGLVRVDHSQRDIDVDDHGDAEGRLQQHVDVIRRNCRGVNHPRLGRVDDQQRRRDLHGDPDLIHNGG
jgi:hypothetical protein